MSSTSFAKCFLCFWIFGISTCSNTQEQEEINIPGEASGVGHTRLRRWEFGLVQAGRIRMQLRI